MWPVKTIFNSLLFKENLDNSEAVPEQFIDGQQKRVSYNN